MLAHDRYPSTQFRVQRASRDPKRTFSDAETGPTYTFVDAPLDFGRLRHLATPMTSRVLFGGDAV